MNKQSLINFKRKYIGFYLYPWILIMSWGIINVSTGDIMRPLIESMSLSQFLIFMAPLFVILLSIPALWLASITMYKIDKKENKK